MVVLPRSRSRKDTVIWGLAKVLQFQQISRWHLIIQLYWRDNKVTCSNYRERVEGCPCWWSLPSYSEVKHVAKLFLGHTSAKTQRKGQAETKGRQFQQVKSGWVFPAPTSKPPWKDPWFSNHQPPKCPHALEYKIRADQKQRKKCYFSECGTGLFFWVEIYPW